MTKRVCQLENKIDALKQELADRTRVSLLTMSAVSYGYT